MRSSRIIRLLLNSRMTPGMLGAGFVFVATRPKVVARAEFWEGEYTSLPREAQGNSCEAIKKRTEWLYSVAKSEAASNNRRDYVNGALRSAEESLNSYHQCIRKKLGS